MLLNRVSDNVVPCQALLDVLPVHSEERAISL